MPFRFVNPNFHVILIHYPLGVFVLGVLLELFSFMWRTSSVRVAARWMILLGGLASLVSSTSGIYALSDVANHQTMTAERYRMLRWHVLLVGSGSLVAVLFAVFGLAASDGWRRRLYFPVLLGLVAAWGLFTVGSWFGGETIYTQGTAVSTKALKAKKATTDEPKTETSEAQAAKPPKSKLKFYVGDPVQIHMITAGLAFALAFGALGLSIRKITALYPDEPEAVIAADLASAPLTHDLDVANTFAPPTDVVPVFRVAEEPRLPAATFWLVTALIALATAVGGYWVWADMSDSWNFQSFWQEVMVSAAGKPIWTAPAVHVWIGVLLVVLSLILAMLAHWAGQRGAVLAVFAVLLVLVIAAQVWIGVLLQFPELQSPFPTGGDSPSHPAAAAAVPALITPRSM